MGKTRQKRKFGMDPASGKLILGSWHVPMPRSRAGRIGIGSALMVGGTLGFLPVLGFWMLPLGFVVLSNDISFIRRRRRRIVVWWAKRKGRKTTEGGETDVSGDLRISDRMPRANR